MHIVFIAYGKRNEVEWMLRDMEAQKHPWPMWKGKKKQSIWIQGQVRVLPLGIYEYVFPREDKDKVLNTLIKSGNYDKILGKLKLLFIKKIYKLKEIPEFKKDFKYLWITENVGIIPIGIHEDVDLTNKEGWTHEAI